MEFCLNPFHTGRTRDGGNEKVLFSALKLQHCVEIDGEYSQIEPATIMTALKHILGYFRCNKILCNGIIVHKVYVHNACHKAALQKYINSASKIYNIWIYSFISQFLLFYPIDCDPLLESMKSLIC